MAKNTGRIPKLVMDRDMLAIQQIHKELASPDWENIVKAANKKEKREARRAAASLAQKSKRKSEKLERTIRQKKWLG